MLNRKTENLTKANWKDIIERNLSSINLVVNKSYLNNAFAIEILSAKDVKEFEKQFAKNLARTINTYLEEKGMDPKRVNRSITYSINDKNNNLVINF